MPQVMLELGVDPDAEPIVTHEEIDSKNRETRFEAFRLICAQKQWTPEMLGEKPTQEIASALERNEGQCPPLGVLAGFVTEFVAQQ